MMFRMRHLFGPMMINNNKLCESKVENNIKFTKSKTNSIVVLLDVMGYGDISTNGNPLSETPNFDRLQNVIKINH